MRSSAATARISGFGELGVLGPQVGAGVGQGADEPGGVVVGERLVQVVDGALGAGGQAGEGGDLAGEAAQVGRVAAGPGGHRPVSSPCIAGGLDAFLAGASGLAGAQAEVAALCGLAAGDSEGAGKVGPAGALIAGELPPGYDLLVGHPQPT